MREDLRIKSTCSIPTEQKCPTYGYYGNYVQRAVCSASRMYNAPTRASDGLASRYGDREREKTGQRTGGWRTRAREWVMMSGDTRAANERKRRFTRDQREQVRSMVMIADTRTQM